MITAWNLSAALVERARSCWTWIDLYSLKQIHMKKSIGTLQLAQRFALRVPWLRSRRYGIAASSRGCIMLRQGRHGRNMQKKLTRSIDFHGSPVEITLTDENGTRSESEMNGMMNWYA